MVTHSPLVARLASALMSVAAFCYAVAAFLCLHTHLHFPPTEAVAVGRVTIERVSKLGDYASYALFIVLVPLLTWFFQRLMEAAQMRLSRFARTDDSSHLARTTIFTIPFMLAPFFFLTTRKEGWALLLPLFLATGALSIERAWTTRTSLRRLFTPALLPFHGLLLAEAVAWILFRYITTGTRIAHIPTLFLESVFLVFFLLLFEAATIGITKMISLLSSRSEGDVLPRVIWAGAPLLLLPFIGLTLLPREPLLLAVIAMILLLQLIVRHRVPSASATRRTLVIAIIPALLFVFSYASTAAPSWLDLFHRGETLGPASDYLQGKAPYRGVLALHGLLEDGLLDAWLMDLFGRSTDVALARITVIGSLTLPVLFLLGYALFHSVGLALATTALGVVTFVDNQRFVFHLVVVALVVHSIRSGRFRSMFLAGVVSTLALFYSFDVGLFALVGTALALVLIAVAAKHSRERQPLPIARALAVYAGGAAAASLPFVIYLASHGALGAFAEISFITVPSIIDAAWSLPYPPLGETFRNDLSLRSLADFLLGEKMRFLLNPLVIVVSLTLLLFRFFSRRIDLLDILLLLLVTSATIAQRSALGRADFRHQYFAAYLIAPILVILAMRFWQSVRGEEGAAVAFRWLLGFAGAVVAFIALWIPDLLNARLDGVVSYRPRLSQIGFNDPQGEAVRDRVERVRYFTNLVTKPKEAIFDFSNQPAFYFLLDRSNPTRFYQVPIASPLRFQREIIRDLDRSKPRLVLRGSPERYDRFDGISNDVRAPLVAAYLDATYSIWRSAAGVELWLRRAHAEMLPLQSSVRLPDQASDFAEEAMIFPAVGSVTGAGLAEWRADLIAYNPTAEPTRLRMRYLADRGNVEKEITLAPFRNTVLIDVAGHFLGMPQSRGALFVRHVEGERPIVTLQTYDATRPSSRFSDTPLSSFAAATGGSSHHALTLIGVDTRPDRRVNLGVVNVGTGTVRLKVVCRTASGEVVGVPVQALVEEAMTYSLVDAARELGVALDGSTTIHINLLEGKAIGYASVVDPVSGSHYSITAVPSTFK